MIIDITKATLSDIPVIAQLEKESFTYPWSEELIKREVFSSASLVIVAKTDTRDLVGHAMFMVMYDEIHISKIAVKPQYRRLGIGEKLIRLLLQTAKDNGFYDITLEVRVSNEGAIKLYEKCGFESVGVRKHYYTDNNEDAMIMWLHMKEGGLNE